MGGFEVVRVVPENERPTEAPVPPWSVSQESATEQDWEDYWLARDAYYHGIELRRI